jgi:hypothetical protein
MQSSLERAKRLSALMRNVLAVLGVLVAAVGLYGVASVVSDGPWLKSWLTEQTGIEGGFGSGSGQRFAIAAFLIVQVAVFMAALHALRKMFGAIAAAEALSQQTAALMRRAGVLFATLAALMVLAHPLNSLLATLNAPAGQRMVSIAVGTPELLALLLSAVLIVLGHIQMLAAEISDDNRQIV